MKKTNILLLLIVALAFACRFWLVTSVPPSLYWDEVSQGYNAYSILKTGRDEHQEFLPIARFQAFGDYKAPVYIYLDVPFIAALGKTELAVRLPSIIFGSLTVLSVYFLVQNLLKTNTNKQTLGLLSSFFLAISPWHIQLSRAAYEANIATFFTVLGITLFFAALQKKPWLFISSSISLVLAIYSFNAHRVFVPLLILLVSVLYWKVLWKNKMQVIVAGIVGVILLAPFIFYIRTPESKLRFQEVNIFSDVAIVKKSNQLIAQDHNSLLAKIVFNRRILYTKEYLKHYFDFFSPEYLFFKGDVNPRFSDQDTGELFIWMLPMLLLGGYMLCIRKDKTTIIILGWFILAPIAGATARETPHALRSETFIPMYEVIAAIGAYGLYSLIKRLSVKLLSAFYVVSVFVVVFYVIQFWHSYLVHNPVRFSTDWQYGYKQTVQQVSKVADNYDKIYFTDTYGRAYMYVAWYSDITPQQFWQDVHETRDVYGLYNVSQLGKYYFTDNYSDSDTGKILYVTSPTHIPAKTKTISTVSFLNGEPAFVISEKL